MSQTGRNTCSAAFALYRLSASYTGPTVDVYNAGTTTSFYADVNGNLGTALNATGTAYSYGNSGYIVKWYDQSGNGNHATQAYTNAPTLNYTSKFADFTTYSGASYMNLPTGTVPENVTYTMICKHGTTNSTTSGFIGGGVAAVSQSNNMRVNGTAGYYNYWYGNDILITTPVLPGNVVTFKYDGSSVTYGYVNSVFISSTARSGWNGQAGNETLARTVAGETLNGQMYYFLIFRSALSDTDRFAAETLSPFNKISFIPTTGPIDFLNIGAATNQTGGPIDLGTLQSQYKTFGGGSVDLNTCYSLVNGFNPAWCMDAANYQSGTVWKDANTTNNYDMTIAAAAYTSSWNDGTPTMQFDGSSGGTKGAAKRVVGGALTQVPFTASGTTTVSFNAVNNLVGTSASYDWNWRTLYRSVISSSDIQPYHPVIIEYGGQNSGSSRMGDYIGYFSSSGTDIVTGPVPIPYAYQQNNMLVHKYRNTSPYYEYQLNNVMTTYTITDTNAALNANSGTAAIGCWHHQTISATDCDQYWGNVATVFMYNSILTNAQIQDLYTRFCPRFYGFNTPALGVLPVTSGLVGWYTGESWTGSQWTDLSGSANHVTSVSGTISTGTFTNNILKFVYGGTGTVLTWPSAILPSTYTLFHVTRYGNAAGTGTTYRRILTGVGQNWLSGHWNGASGVAYHDGWLTQYTKTLHGTQWVVSSDQNGLYRSQGYQRGTGGGTDAPQTYSQLCINSGVAGSETSDWSIASVIVFNRTLSTAEMVSMEKWLNIRYNVVAAPNLTPILVNPGTQTFTIGGSFTITQSVIGTGGITWGYTSVSGLSLSSSSDTSATFTIAKLTAISTQNITVTATNPSGVVCSTVFSITNTLPTGGTITVSGSTRIHTFTTSGTFTTYASVTSQVLIVGGGGGAGFDGGGGGGGGGVVYYASQALSGSYTVTVGGGGAAAAGYATNGVNGGNSSVTGLTVALGGGGGGDGHAQTLTLSTGGSGGGGGFANNPDNGTVLAPGSGTSGQGNNGGAAYYNTAGGGGGGAGAVGGAAANQQGGTGGNGVAYSISGTSTYYGGGGGGGSWNGAPGAGGLGGGGQGGGNHYSGTLQNPTPGTANTGGGGGGNGFASDGVSASGGSGIVIIAY